MYFQVNWPGSPKLPLYRVILVGLTGPVVTAAVAANCLSTVIQSFAFAGGFYTDGNTW
jgi:hypothetical protein